MNSVAVKKATATKALQDTELSTSTMTDAMIIAALNRHERAFVLLALSIPAGTDFYIEVMAATERAVAESKWRANGHRSH